MAKTIDELEAEIKLYERSGAAAMFYALNRKLNEIASLLNSVNLKTVDIAAKSDSSFERIFKLLEKAESISSAAKALGEVANVTNDESKDTKTPIFRISPESMADSIGELAGQRR